MELRHSVQLIFLTIAFFVTGALCSFKIGILFVSCPLGILQAMGATRSFLLSAVLASLVLVVLTIVAGRFFCGWICPIGTITEHGGKLFPKPQARFDSQHRNSKYGLLAAILVSAALFRYTVFCPICPIGVASRAVSLRGFFLGPELLVLLAIFFAEALERRTWCKYLCPIGALLALISRFRIFRLRINLDKCIHCNRCLRECKNNQMDILGPEALKTGVIRDDECNFCLQCTESCTKGAIEAYNILKKQESPIDKPKEFSVEKKAF